MHLQHSRAHTVRARGQGRTGHVHAGFAFPRSQPAQCPGQAATRAGDAPPTDTQRRKTSVRSGVRVGGGERSREGNTGRIQREVGLGRGEALEVAEGVHSICFWPGGPPLFVNRAVILRGVSAPPDKTLRAEVVSVLCTMTPPAPSREPLPRLPVCV